MLRNYPDVLNVKQLCEAIGIGRNKAYELLNSNCIKHKRIGKNFCIPKKFVIKYLNEV